MCKYTIIISYHIIISLHFLEEYKPPFPSHGIHIPFVMASLNKSLKIVTSLLAYFNIFSPLSMRTCLVRSLTTSISVLVLFFTPSWRISYWVLEFEESLANVRIVLIQVLLDRCHIHESICNQFQLIIIENKRILGERNYFTNGVPNHAFHISQCFPSTFYFKGSIKLLL